MLVIGVIKQLSNLLGHHLVGTKVTTATRPRAEDDLVFSSSGGSTTPKLSICE